MLFFFKTRTAFDLRISDVSAYVCSSDLNAEAVVLTMDDPVQQLRMTRRLRGKYPDLPIISRARGADHAAALYQAGATDAVPETLESSLQLAEAVLVGLGAPKIGRAHV